MFKNYLLTTIRSLGKNKLFSLINIGGLAIGMAACILIFLYVKDELSYDSFLPDSQDVYILDATFNTPGRDPIRGMFAPAILSDFLKPEFPEIDEITTVANANINIRKEDVLFAENILFADPSFDKILQYPVKEGDLRRVLGDNFSIAISEAMAVKYFGSASALGKTIPGIINNEERTYRVEAVFYDLPDTSNQQFDFLLRMKEEYFPPSPFSSRPIMENWVSLTFNTYVKLLPGSDPASVESKIPALLDRIVPDYVTQSLDVKPHQYMEFKFLPLSRIHLNSDAGGLAGVPAVNPNTLILLGALALLILSIASINFMNLATARSSLRAKEVAIRKTLGAKRRQLVILFLGEATLLSGISMVLALALVEMMLPVYNHLIDKMISANYFAEAGLLTALAGLATVVGIGAGMYPAFYLSSFNPAKVLKSNQSSSKGSPRLRTALVIIQFSISIGLIIATAVIFNQTKFARDIDLGFDRASILLVRGAGNATPQQRENFIRQIGRQPDVLNVTNSTVVPSDGLPISTQVTLSGEAEARMVGYVPIGFNFFATYHVEPVAGRLFSREFSQDPAVGSGEQGQRAEANAILNETAVRFFGFDTAQEALDKRFTAGINFKTDFTIVGVVPDMNFATVRQNIRPEVFNINENGGTISIRYHTEDLQKLLNFIDTTWAEVFPDLPLAHQFLDANIDALYQADANLGLMLAVFAGLAVAVSALGLFGLSSYSVELKTKEIGIRKVMGASVPELVRLLIWQLSKPVFIANLVAWPVAWYFINDWLLGFAERINLSPFYFFTAGLVALFIAWITVGGLVLKVARTNPIHALRYE